MAKKRQPTREELEKEAAAELNRSIRGSFEPQQSSYSRPMRSAAPPSWEQGQGPPDDAPEGYVNWGTASEEEEAVTELAIQQMAERWGGQGALEDHVMSRVNPNQAEDARDRALRQAMANQARFAKPSRRVPVPTATSRGFAGTWTSTSPAAESSEPMAWESAIPAGGLSDRRAGKQAAPTGRAATKRSPAKKATPAKKKAAPKKATPAKKKAAPKKATPAKKKAAPKKATPAKKKAAPATKRVVKRAAKKAAPAKRAPAKKIAPAKKATPAKKAPARTSAPVRKAAPAKKASPVKKSAPATKRVKKAAPARKRVGR